MTGGVEILAFAGPRGQLFAGGQRLYAATPDGLDVWDPHTGERTGSVPGFTPTSHHPRTGEFAAVEHGVLRRWASSQGPMPGATTAH